MVKAIFLKHVYLISLFNLSAGFNSTLRQGNITHHEYIQVSGALVFF